MYQGPTILLLGYFSAMEPKFSLLLGLFMWFSKVSAAPPEIVRTIKSLECTSSFPWFLGPGHSHTAFVAPLTLQIMVLWPGTHVSKGKKVKAIFQEPMLKKRGFWGKRRHFSSVLSTGPLPFFSNFKARGCYSAINNVTFCIETESTLWNTFI